MSSYFNELKSLNITVLSPAFHDFMRSMPDSIFLGSSIFAMLTQNYPLGIFVFAMLEFGLVHRLFGGLISIVQSPETKPQTLACTPGIPSPYLVSIIGKLLAQTPFPSGPVFFMSAVISYTLAAILNFREEVHELGKTQTDWALRIPLSFSFSFLLLVLFIVWRYMNSCDDFLSILGSVALGLVLGGLIHVVHVYLFGRDSINFLGVPLLADRAANGRPLYVCAPQTKQA
jgi:hypothetical protein